MRRFVAAKVLSAVVIVGVVTLTLAPSAANAAVLVGGGSSTGTVINVKQASIMPGGYSCNSSGWGFIINQLKGYSAPSYISVTWNYSNTATIPLSKVTGGAAHYDTSLYLNEMVTSASVVIAPAWTSGHGQFVLSHGPC